VDERLARLEQAVQDLRDENQQLRRDMALLQERLEAPSQTAASAESADDTCASADERRWFKSRWAYIGLVCGLIAVPILTLVFWRGSGAWSAVIGAVNALIVYFIGPGAIRLLAEGLLRAIPGVLLGQTARITLDNMRKKKAR
jgi:hypothetical protein